MSMSMMKIPRGLSDNDEGGEIKHCWARHDEEKEMCENKMFVNWRPIFSIC